MVQAAYYKGGSTNAGYFDYPTSSDTPRGRIWPMSRGTTPTTGSAAARTHRSPVLHHGGGEFQNSESPAARSTGWKRVEWNEGVVSGSSRCLRGGPFPNDSPALRASFAPDHPLDEEDHIGFRVVRVSDSDGDGIPDAVDNCLRPRTRIRPTGMPTA